MGRSGLLLSELSNAQYQSAVKKSELNIEFGLISVNVNSSFSQVTKTISELYRDYNVTLSSDWFDFNVSVEKPSNFRRFFRSQAVFKLDGHIPFKPLPSAHAYPLFEWGMNWCVANFYHRYLIFHAAVLEKNGKAVIFPAPPGSGKSTLCAYLALSGWRLLSDEMAVLDIETGNVLPFVRPICLKNNSIRLVEDWFPEAFISEVATDTQKGDVAHVRPPTDSVRRCGEGAKLFAIVFPQFKAGSTTEIFSMTQMNTLKMLVENAFNFDLFGHEGFEFISRKLPDLLLLEATYSNVDDLRTVLESEVQD